jgi:hypothetical protein
MRREDHRGAEKRAGRLTIQLPVSTSIFQRARPAAARSAMFSALTGKSVMKELR